MQVTLDRHEGWKRLAEAVDRLPAPTEKSPPKPTDEEKKARRKAQLERLWFISQGTFE